MVSNVNFIKVTFLKDKSMKMTPKETFIKLFKLQVRKAPFCSIPQPNPSKSSIRILDCNNSTEASFTSMDPFTNANPAVYNAKTLTFAPNARVDTL